MGKFRASGLDDIIKQMDSMGEMMGEVADRMLYAGADEVKKAWRQVALELAYKDTGRLIESIGYAKGRSGKISDVRQVAIYPQGKNHKNVRNAEVASILHYGTSKRPGSHWVDKAEALSEPEIERVITEIFDEELGKRGMK